MYTRKSQGFTLIELMIAVGILGIIITIGYPAYNDQVRKSRRAEGMGELLELADRMERHYSDVGTYDQSLGGADMTAAVLLNKSPATTTEDYYTLSIDAGTSNVAFKARATPTTKGKQNLDKCGTFIIDSQGVKTLDTTNGSTRTATGYQNVDCWR